MRFAVLTTALVAVAIAAGVSAAPAPAAATPALVARGKSGGWKSSKTTSAKSSKSTSSSGDIQTVGKGICFIESGLGITDIEDEINSLLGGLIDGVEDALGITSLEDSLGLESCDGETSGLSDIQQVGKGLCYIEKGLGITDIEDFVDSLLGGAVDDIEDKLGITSLEEALDLEGC